MGWARDYDSSSDFSYMTGTSKETKRKKSDILGKIGTLEVGRGTVVTGYEGTGQGAIGT